MTTERLEELFPTYEQTKGDTGPHLRVCVGSWKAYNECNEHGLGSCYGDRRFFIDFMQLEGSEELYEVLTAIGWSEAEQEELFVQDYESDFLEIDNCDYENPARLADFIQEHRDVIERDHETIEAIMEATGSSFEEAIEHLNNYIYYPGRDGADYEEEMLSSSFDIPDWLRRYIDFQAMWDDDCANGNYYETSNGILIGY